jgi:ADP-ribose pyrophosphatase YjhB (NUDIX family)
MVEIHVGERVAKDGHLAVGCSASVFDADGRRMLFVRRVDDDRWAVPGGYMEPGESLTEACQREVLEEAGLSVEIQRLIGVYTSPNLLVEYPDGSKWQLVVCHFEAKATGGAFTPNSETSEARYFSQLEAEALEMSRLDRRRMLDGFLRQEHAIICDDFSLGASEG